ncbi:hypothetical protein L195_g061205, partial [Trifolium pratense]
GLIGTSIDIVEDANVKLVMGAVTPIVVETVDGAVTPNVLDTDRELFMSSY